MQIKDEIKIEGLKNFEQYMKINPINIQIIDPEIQSKLLFYSKKYKYRLVANNLLFSSLIVKDTNNISISKNELNDAKDILINRKMLQGIGVIYTSEIEGWEKIKNESHWKNAILTDKLSNCSQTFCVWI